MILKSVPLVPFANQEFLFEILTVISLGTRVALAYALAGPVGVRGIWISIPIGWLLADGAGLLYYRRHRNTLLSDL